VAAAVAESPPRRDAGSRLQQSSPHFFVVLKAIQMNPRPTELEDRAARSHREATAMIETERALREAKTARLRALRLAKERKDAAPAKKPARRKKTSA
jgi:hypothetical protein